VLIVGQAPGTRVHKTGIPWNDPSGDRLREWLGIDREVFYDESQIAIIPMGLCYPGRGKSGDLPPRKECAELWLDGLYSQLPRVCLRILIGRYAQAHYLGTAATGGGVTATVRAWRDFAPGAFPLPHPSPRNNLWLRRNNWFERDVLPELRVAFRAALDGP